VQRDDPVNAEGGNYDTHDAPSETATLLTRAVTGRARILIVDDHPVFCDGLRALLERTQSFEVVGEAWTSSDAVALTRRLQPAIIVLDIVLENERLNGLDLVSQLRHICPDVRIAVLTGHTGQEHLISALRLGVQAFLQKDLPAHVLLDALLQVRAGERVIAKPQDLTLALTELYKVARQREREQSCLTDHEIQMLRLAAAGHSNKEIGASQYWSEITVKRKMQSVYRKLGVSSRAQAVAEVIRLGFI
jgi:DNA-binding NarL/FixJ family response regulator